MIVEARGRHELALSMVDNRVMVRFRKWDLGLGWIRDYE